MRNARTTIPVHPGSSSVIWKLPPITTFSGLHAVLRASLIMSMVRFERAQLPSVQVRRLENADVTEKSMRREGIWKEVDGGIATEASERRGRESQVRDCSRKTKSLCIEG